jgi:FMN phosphatase YigB (HAD superfamily)
MEWNGRKILILFFCFSLHAEIIQTNSLEDVLRAVDETAWVVFDIDNTLLESAVQAGRAEWFDHEVKQLMLTKGIDRHTADLCLFPAWVSFMEICPMQTPEPKTAGWVKEIQEKSSASLALTARHPPLAKLTLRQLGQFGIDFSHHAPPEVSLDTEHPSHTEEGIVFASIKNSKAALFRQFIEKSDKKPGKILFIDDALHHLEQMEMELQKLGIAFTGFHYTKSFERPFDFELASIEYHAITTQHLRESL